MNRNGIIRFIVAIALIAFAGTTLFMSSSVLFDWFGIRAKQGDYVPFIVWTNFTAGFLYLIAAWGLLKSKKWAFWLLSATAVLLFIALMGLLRHIDSGGLFEMKTVGAMGFRTVLTIIFAVIAYYQSRKRRHESI